MNFGNLLKIALKAISNNMLRSFLTMLGIIIGVASVTAAAFIAPIIAITAIIGLGILAIGSKIVDNARV